jgi:5-methylcytosine-specific restriction endonuclease McrA
MIKKCTIEGCCAEVGKRRLSLCDKHYIQDYRLRTGRAKRKMSDIVKPVGSTQLQTKGYMREKVEASHYLSNNGKQLWPYQHRVRLFEAYGMDISCAICSIRLTWDKAVGDHLDKNTTNNNLSNLRILCQPCNVLIERDRIKKTHRSKGRMLTYKGQTLCFTEWAEKIGISRASLQYRLTQGWEDDRIFQTPRGKTGPR